ncbi:MAG: hypothetical protein AB7P20_00410 [Rhizobiaceae bacterium]
MRDKLLAATAFTVALGIVGVSDAAAQMGRGMMDWYNCPTSGGMMGRGMMGPGMMDGNDYPMYGGMGGRGTMGPGMMGRGMIGRRMMGQGMMDGYDYPMYGGMMGGSGRVQPTYNLTTSDVTNYFNSWIKAQSNPNIKLGSVSEKDSEIITAEVVTKEGSLVERFNVDRHTGMVQQAN